MFNSNYFESRDKLYEWRTCKLQLVLMIGTLTKGFYLLGSTSFEVNCDVIVELALDSEHVIGLHAASLEFRKTVC